MYILNLETMPSKFGKAANSQAKKSPSFFHCTWFHRGSISTNHNDDHKHVAIIGTPDVARILSGAAPLSKHDTCNPANPNLI